MSSATAAAATQTTPVNSTNSTNAATTPTPNRDMEDGKTFCESKSHRPLRCKAHKPTLAELQEKSFSDYIRTVVLDGARVTYQDEVQRSANDSNNNHTNYCRPTLVHYVEDAELDEYGFPSRPQRFAEGMAKVSLPDGFWKEEGIGKDRTGRGPAFQKGTPLGDMIIHNPIRQCVRGIGGVYEYTLLDQPSIPLHAFRDQADAYLEEQLLGMKKRKSPDSSNKKKKKKEPVVNTTRKTKNSIKRALEEEEEKKKEEVKGKEPKAVKKSRPESPEVEIDHNSNIVPRDENNSEDEDENNNNDDATQENTADNNSNSPSQQSAKKKLPSAEEMERKFWKRLGPTMPPATYGADMEGSLFGDDPACGWNLSNLDSFLQLLGPNLPGVTSPYLYFGMWASAFAAHTEDMNLLSINYLHAGAPKIWYAVAPGPDAQRMEALFEHYFAHAHQDCKQFLRHKRSLLSPMILKKAGIKYTTQIQYPGEAMITIPGGYHFGFNTGFNIAEATNFGVPEWIPFGHEARICMCRPDSVRIDMFRLERLHARYMKENKKKTSRRRKSFRDWGLQYYDAHNKVEDDSESESESEDEEVDVHNKNVNGKPHGKKRKKDFWVEVMAPIPCNQRADFGRRGTNHHRHMQNNNNNNSENSNKVSGRKRARSGKAQQKRVIVEREVWHLAKPMTRKGLVAGAKVLVMIPGRVSKENEPDLQKQKQKLELSDSSSSDESSGEEDEQCFAGVITEFSDDYARVHFDRLPKDDDVWMHIDSHKLLLDGGSWDDKHETKGLPPRHFWQEMDSKRRCS